MRWIARICQAEYITLLFALILITPVCGTLFACGCTWPGLGLDAKCNFYDPQESYHCPWCASFLAGSLSVSSAIATAYMIAKTSASPFSRWIKPGSVRFAMQLFAGLTGCLVIAFTAGWISAVLQHYPYFIEAKESLTWTPPVLQVQFLTK